MYEFLFVLVFLVFFGVGFIILHKKLEEILQVLVEINDK